MEEMLELYPPEDAFRYYILDLYSMLDWTNLEFIHGNEKFALRMSFIFQQEVQMSPPAAA